MLTIKALYYVATICPGIQRESYCANDLCINIYVLTNDLSGNFVELFLHACVHAYVTYACMLNGARCLLGTVIEGPSNITYLPGLTQLPIELTCNINGVALWEVNRTSYRLDELDDGDLPGHDRTGTNILVDGPVNNTEYICVSQTNDGITFSDPAYIIIAGEQYICTHIYFDCGNKFYLLC